MAPTKDRNVSGDSQTQRTHSHRSGKEYIGRDLGEDENNIINPAISGMRGQYFLYVADASDRWDWHLAYVP
jgi:hypothetical protein